MGFGVRVRAGIWLRVRARVRVRAMVRVRVRASLRARGTLARALVAPSRPFQKLLSGCLG